MNRTLGRLAALCVAVGLCAVCGGTWAAAAGMADEIPFVEGQPLPAARPGEGWTLVRKPATYKTVTETVEVSPSTFYVESIPAKFETKDEWVMVAPEKKIGTAIPAKLKTEAIQHLAKEEFTRYEIAPAKFETVEEEVVIAPAHQEMVAIPAEYKTVTEQIEAAPARGYWMKDGEKFCYREIPAKYVTITKQVLEKEATTKMVDIPAKTMKVKVLKKVADAEAHKQMVPAEYQTLEKQVLEAPSSVAYEKVPAQFEVVHKEVMTEPAATRRVEIPAKFETVTKQVLDEPSKLVWRKVTCEPRDVVKKYEELPGADLDSLLRLAK